MAIPTLDLFEKIMAGHQITISEIDEIINKKLDEDLFLEYKHGDELTKKNSPATIRQYLSGFANSAGGVLVIGISENWTVTGCAAPGGGDLADWASRCITPIAAYFSPLPRFQVVQHSQGNILIASVDRSLSLVPEIENRSLVYYLRVHDQTLKAPEYLMSDLLLGRRSRPSLQFKSLEMVELAGSTSNEYGNRAVKFDFHSVIENHSLTWADDVRIGIVSWFADKTQGDRPISGHLLTYVDVSTVDDDMLSKNCYIGHRALKLGSIGAFDTVSRNAFSSFTLPVCIQYTWFQYHWHAVIYIVAQNTSPVWYEVTINVCKELFMTAQGQRSIAPGHLFVLSRVSDRRPKIACTDIKRSG